MSEQKPEKKRRNRRRQYMLVTVNEDGSFKPVKEVADVHDAKKQVKAGDLGNGVFQVITVASGKLSRGEKTVAVLKEEG